MVERKKALGRGLSALLPEAEPALQQVSVSEIAFNPHQPRQRIDETALAELVDSVREHGVLQPLILCPVPAESGKRYVVVAGERRLRAAQLAGLAYVPALVRDLDAKARLEVALIENLQREDLNAVEASQAYQQLLTEFGLTQEEVAHRVGKSRSAVANSLRLLKLPTEVLSLLRSGQLTEGHARALLALPTPTAIRHTAQEVLDRGLSVRQTEALVSHRLDEAGAGRKESKRTPARDPHSAALEEAMRGRLGTKVVLQRGRRGGKVVIHYYSDEELDTIYRAIVGEG
ncbi:MAG: ParB/RepB/Spo0J family partition protein [Anaerolineae bacterium]